METAALVAILGFAGTVITAGIGAYVAITINRSEKKATAETTAENTMEKTLRERIQLRDEQLLDKGGEVAEYKALWLEAAGENQSLRAENASLRAENAKLSGGAK